MKTKHKWSATIGFTVLVLLMGCGEAPKQEDKKTVNLTMDMPKPDSNLKKSNDNFDTKPLPAIKKSNITFKIDPAEIKKRIAEHPVMDETSCLDLVAPLQKKIDAILRNEGMWGHLEKVPELKEYSPLGMQLDSKINTMVSSALHICKTAKGLPYTNLAKFINSRLEERGEPALREYLSSAGETPTDINIILEYGAFAKAAKTRVLDYPSIQESVLWAGMFVDRYQGFAKQLEGKKSLETALPDIQALHDAIADFLANNKNMAIAVKEEKAIPAYNQ